MHQKLALAKVWHLTCYASALVNEVAFGYGINGASRCTMWGKSYHSPSIRGSSFPIEILDYNLVLEMLISTSGRLQTYVVLLR